MKWFFRLVIVIGLAGLAYAGVLGYVVYRMATVDSVFAVTAYRPAFTRLTLPLRLIPYFRDRIDFVQAGMEMVETAAPILHLDPAYLYTKGVSREEAAALQQLWPYLRTQIQYLCQTYPTEPSYIKRRIPLTVEQGCQLITQNPATLNAVADGIRELPTLLGHDKPMHYVALFQNNMELRPTGGFMGSYADIWFKQGRLDSIHIQDIYVPDGQIKGYVKEPEPIRKHLFNDNHPGWRLRDANWHPDFPESTKAIDWFFTEGNLQPADGFIAVNLFPIIDILTYTQGVYLPDYNLTVTADNFYQEAQRHAEENFFPGSTQKGDFLRSIGNALLTKLESEPNLSAALTPVILRALEQRHLLVHFPGISLPQFRTLGWDGSLKAPTTDYLMVNESNLGSNKANCCIDRSLYDDVVISDSGIKHTLSLSYQNRNEAAPKPPNRWGGGYKNYLRIITPPDVTEMSVTVDGKSLPPQDILSEVFTTGHHAAGFLVLTEGGHTSQVTVTYTIPLVQPLTTYQLLFQKQSGIEEWPYTFNIQGEKYVNISNKDILFDVSL